MGSPNKTATALLIAVLEGCASIGDEWTKTRPASIKPWLYVKVAEADFVCRTLGADPRRRLGRINACATWQPVNCVIYLPENAPAWLIAHEEKHCEGYSHD